MQICWYPFLCALSHPDWPGVPIVHMAGPNHKFTQRMCGSLLRAAGVPELIAAGHSDYIRLAVELATNATYLTAVKSRIRAAATAPDTTQVLFRPAVGATRLAKALQIAYRSWRSGLPKKDILVDNDWYRLM